MRRGLLVLVLVPGMTVGIGLFHGWLANVYQHAAEAGLSDEARSAIELRCKGLEGSAATDCRSLHAKLYLAGTLDPERTLRDHCTPAKTVAWGTRPPAPPALCVQRYGGWHKGKRRAQPEPGGSA